MRHSAILAGADIAPNVKSELIDDADLKGLTLLYDNIFFDMVPKSAWRGVPEHASSEETDRAFLENFRPFDDLFWFRNLRLQNAGRSYSKFGSHCPRN